MYFSLFFDSSSKLHNHPAQPQHVNFSPISNYIHIIEDQIMPASTCSRELSANRIECAPFDIHSEVPQLGPSAAWPSAKTKRIACYNWSVASEKHMHAIRAGSVKSNAMAVSLVELANGASTPRSVLTTEGSHGEDRHPIGPALHLRIPREQ